MLNLEELKQLVSFAYSGTLAKVAEDFHISTPSVTRSMKNLEESFGVTLFVRSKNKIALNETGRVAVTYARKLLQETEQMLTAIQDFDERQHTITVKSCAPAPLWELLKKIEKKNIPDSQFHPGYVRTMKLYSLWKKMHVIMQYCHINYRFLIGAQKNL